MIYLCCLRCLRDLKKWSWLGKIGKNEQKWGKNGVKWLSENPHLYTTHVKLTFSIDKSPHMVIFRDILLRRSKLIKQWVPYDPSDHFVESGPITFVRAGKYLFYLKGGPSDLGTKILQKY